MRIDLRANIRYAMKRIGIGAEEMGAALGISRQSFYYRMEDPEARFCLADLRTIARKTDTTEAWLISGTPAKR